MAQKSLPVRLPQGFYEAVSEIAKALKMDKSTTVGIVLALGLEEVRSDFFTERVNALIRADSMESSAAFLRAWADLTPEQRKEWEEEFGGFIKRLVDVFQGYKGLGELKG